VSGGVLLEFLELRARAGVEKHRDKLGDVHVPKRRSGFARLLRNVTLAACTMAAGFGCAAQPKPLATTQPPPPVQPPPTTGVARTASVHAGVDEISIDCQPGAKETCNAIDDDCNGVIDDGCGYSTGAVQVTMGWDTGADIDMYITDPSGSPLYYNEQHRKSALGGQMDHDARGDCRREQQNPQIENAYWPAPAPSGSYEIELHYFGPCGAFGNTHVTVSVSALGKSLGTYRYELKPEERVKALSLIVP
jgi:tRNA (guanosine-2'-O-)-methyltransferase